MFCGYQSRVAPYLGLPLCFLRHAFLRVCLRATPNVTSELLVQVDGLDPHCRTWITVVVAIGAARQLPEL